MLGLDVRAARVTITVLLVIGVLALFYALRQVIFILLLSLFFAYLLLPLINLIDRFRPAKLSRNLTLVFVYLGVLSLIIVALSALGGEVLDQAVHLQKQLPTLQERANNYLSRIDHPGAMDSSLQTVLLFLRDKLAASAEKLIPTIQNFGLKAVTVVGGTLIYILVPIFAFFFLLEGMTVRESILRSLPQIAGNFFRKVTEDIDAFLGAYIRSLLVLALATFLITIVIFSILKVPYALLLAVCGALLEVIPVVGPLIAAVTAITVALFSGYDHVGWLVIYFIGLRLVQDYVLQPRVFAQGVKLNPLLILIGVFCGEQLGGVAGIFLSIPVMAVLKILNDRARYQ